MHIDAAAHFENPVLKMRGSFLAEFVHFFQLLPVEKTVQSAVIIVLLYGIFPLRIASHDIVKIRSGIVHLSDPLLCGGKLE